MQKRFLFAVSLITLMVSPLVVHAQSISPTTSPGQITPGQIERKLEAPKLPKSGGAPILPKVDNTPQKQQGENIKFILRGVNFTGMNVYDKADMSPIYNEYMNQEISLAKVFDFAAEITAKYRNDGYILSRAIIPPQRVNDGIIDVQVVEGFIDQVSIEGEVLKNPKYLEGYAEAVKNSRPLKASALERFVLLANDLPGAAARVVLLPSPTTTGASDLVVVMNQDDFQRSLTIDNRGSRFLGPIQVSGNVTANSLFDDYSQVSARYVTSTQVSEFNLAELTYTRPISSSGTMLTVTGSRSFVNPGFDIKTFDVESQSTRFSATVFHPIIRTREENLSISSTLDYRNSNTTILASKTSEDRIRSVNISGSYDFLDKFRGINLITPTLTQGLNVADATESGTTLLTRANGRSDFTKLNLDVLRLQNIAPKINLYMAASGQYSFSQLLSSEEFGFGGAQFGRAYDPSEITGDHGVAAQVELRYQDRVGENAILNTYELYTFYDVGVVWSIDDNVVGASTQRSAASFGVGTRLGFAHNVSGNFELAVPLTRPVAARSGSDPSKGNDVRAFFSLIANF